MSIGHIAQEVAQLFVIKHPLKPLQATPLMASSQVRKKLRSTAQLLAHFSPESLPLFAKTRVAQRQLIGL